MDRYRFFNLFDNVSRRSLGLTVLENVHDWRKGFILHNLIFIFRGCYARCHIMSTWIIWTVEGLTATPEEA